MIIFITDAQTFEVIGDQIPGRFFGDRSIAWDEMAKIYICTQDAYVKICAAQEALKCKICGQHQNFLTCEAQAAPNFGSN